MITSPIAAGGRYFSPFFRLLVSLQKWGILPQSRTPPTFELNGPIGVGVLPLVRSKPEIAVSTNSFELCSRRTLKLKHVDPRLAIVLGGPHFSSIANETLKLFPWVDYVVTGEGELALQSLIRYLQGNVGLGDLINVAHRHGQGLGLTRVFKPQRSLATLPFPAYDLVDLTAYFNENPRRLLAYEPGRGCMYRCSFCYSPGHWGQGEQAKSADRVIEELSRLRDLGARHVFFVQDNLLNSKAGTLALCHALTQARLGFTWNCYATLPQLTPEVLDALAEAGCREVFVGVDAVSAISKQSFAKHFFKGWSNLEAQLRACLDRGIVPTCAFMVAPPAEDSCDTDAVLQTALFARNLGCGIRLNTLTLFNQTASASAMREKPRTYTDHKPRLLLDTPEVIHENPYARVHPELFPFHNTHMNLSAYERFVSGMHMAYTLFSNFPRTLLRYMSVDQGTLWRLLDSMMDQLGDLTEIPARQRRAAEREVFSSCFAEKLLSPETRCAFAVEQAELRLTQATSDETITLSVEGEVDAYQSRPFAIVPFPSSPKFSVPRRTRPRGARSLTYSFARAIALRSSRLTTRWEMRFANSRTLKTPESQQ